MAYFIVLVVGFVAGALCTYSLTDRKNRALIESLDERQRQLAQSQSEVRAAEERVERTKNALHLRKDQLNTLASELDKRAAEWEAEAAKERKELAHNLERQRAQLAEECRQVEEHRKEFSARSISYTELQQENHLLKRDLRNLEIATRKLKLDRDTQQGAQAQLDARSRELAGRYMKENVKWINSTLGTNNYTLCKQRLVDVIARCREIGFDVPPTEESDLLANLQAGFEKAVRVALEREEQARIKAQIREEMKLEREREREVQQAELEKKVIQEALAKALAEAHDQHSAEIERLRSRLAEAEAKAERAIAMAQLTKAGHVYVISNLGSFGDGVFKVGMTRRLEPLDRVKELGDASVPFPFDVHMMISSDDAPSLENALHRVLRKHQVNRVNPRKEFFRTDIETIRAIVEANHGVVEYVADQEALEYRQSLTMPEEDQEFIEHVYDELDANDPDLGFQEEDA
jgi:hypothetical protein